MALHKDLPQFPHAILYQCARFYGCTPGWRKIAGKVMDIFDNDTMRLLM